MTVKVLLHTFRLCVCEGLEQTTRLMVSDSTNRLQFKTCLESLPSYFIFTHREPCLFRSKEFVNPFLLPQECGCLCVRTCGALCFYIRIHMLFGIVTERKTFAIHQLARILFTSSWYLFKLLVFIVTFGTITPQYKYSQKKRIIF